ncbi:MAG TPA: hypothetical protein VGI71_00970 [Scandinavium sp.]|jgi:hypothetical protein
MIIPKAVFLQQTYLRNKTDLHIRLKNEYTLAMSLIVGSLRLPQNHKLGALSVLLSADSFPLLCSGEQDETLGEIQKTLEAEGYSIVREIQHNGILFRIDWTGESQRYADR